MGTTLRRISGSREYVPRLSLAGGFGWGLVGGFVATLVMDLILMGALWAVGYDPLSCFSIVGDTVGRVFSLLGDEIAGGVLVGVATHYILGAVIGGIFGIAVSQVRALRFCPRKKMIVLAVLYVEVLSQPLLALTPILLNTAPAETLRWYGGSTIMHSICGVVLGAIVSLRINSANELGE